MKIRSFLVLGGLLATAFANAAPYTLDFDTDSFGNAIAAGSAMSNQYSGWGFSFSANPFVGTGWATNSDMHVSNTDVGGGYTAVHKNVFHTYSGWLNEDDDPSMLITSANDVTDVSMTFIGDTSTASFFACYDINGALVAQSGFAAGSGGDDVVSLTGMSGVRYIAIAPGYYFDWAGVDDVKITTVPEPFSMVALGLGVAAMARKRRK